MTKDEALDLALEALEMPIHEQSFLLKQKAIASIKQALAAPVQEPVYHLRQFGDVTKEQLDRYMATSDIYPQPEPVKTDAWPCLIAEADFEQNTITLEMQCSDYKVGAGQHWLHTTPPAAPVQETVARYCCHSCFKVSGGVMLDRMILCSECGNKRCPKASDHNFSCTGSNEPGQWGSIYTTPPAAQPAVPDAFGTREDEHPEYIQGWNDCRAEMLKRRTA